MSGKLTLSDFQNPLYLHPSDGQHSVSIKELTGAQIYREWRRSMEIILASKRKLGFVAGAVKKDTSDSEKADQFDTCNSMVIAWILANVSEKENRRNILKTDKDEEEVLTMFSSESETGCSVCGRKKHTADKCWKVIGYPRWHPEYKKQQRYKSRGEGSSGEKGAEPKSGHKEGRKIAGSAQNKDDPVSLTAQQLDQLLKLEKETGKIKGVGKAKNGVYYLQNHEHFKEEPKIAKKETHFSMSGFVENVEECKTT
ncbi:hypothetical protein RDABS01_005643 [Bienertia sinuspersici]